MRETNPARGNAPAGRILDWAAAAMGAGASIAETRTLHDDQGPWRLSVVSCGRTTEVVLRAPTPRIDAAGIATGATALALAAQHGLPAPRLLAADLDGSASGVPATLETAAAGTTAWSSPPSVERLRSTGAALALVHSVAMTPCEHLPFRPRPIAVDDFAADRRAGRMPTTPLLRTADDLITAHGLPSGEPVFLHGDVWPGNLVWTRDDIVTLIDWKTAGVGAPGVDLGELRKQVAITFGPDAPAHVLDGWEGHSGVRPRYVAYWDAVAALNTPTELIGAPTHRRDAFLRMALSKLG
ncbi:Predicted kinase, aminoglycoside phosphotransferase (APT) family [Actinopolymorpha cephalotaxi]|uniref:Aminoglycoside phosphotransferase (APT) family kinase protein n=1 Tax=Actinopolymorpha cephalotaxi TaxID=504797 RepID=A0A1I3B154_9ACTN|nr:aminoglycoside phosphotransferase family protein [Actinopolymorpha cephalotaxi]NYH84252.1 aminoglycoside phosphotransferase (APT) family kinase protein [Actinopolymorpha cephalotaxi]SFH55920.1 Predicted kinase, aminoglycoside phosphotransferase (APT) family [Actinopolymorpha cephalotaxi]